MLDYYYMEIYIAYYILIENYFTSLEDEKIKI